jgi:hypothetical protein
VGPDIDPRPQPLTLAADIASISAVEGKNWRHGDIEDILKQVQCIRKHKWNSMMMKRKFDRQIYSPNH